MSRRDMYVCTGEEAVTHPAERKEAKQGPIEEGTRR